MQLLSRENSRGLLERPFFTIETSLFMMVPHMIAFVGKSINLANSPARISRLQGVALNLWFSAQITKMRQH